MAIYEKGFGDMIDFEYNNTGKAKTMVCVHGFTQHRAIFDRQVRYFEQYVNIVALDLRGHGKSSHLDGPYGIEEYTDDVQDIFETLGLQQVIYWGTHTGTGIGLMLYLRNPQFISHFILEGVVLPGMETPDITRNIERTKQVMVQHGLRSALSDWLNHSGWFQYMREHPEITRYHEHKQIIEMFTGKPWQPSALPRKVTNVFERLNEFHVDVLAYNGQFDMEEFLNMTAVLETNIHASKHIVPGSGGFPLWENPSFVNTIVLNWLQEKNAL